LLTAALIILAAGCDDSGGITIPSGVTQLSISAKANDNLSNPQDIIVITEAKALVSTVDFEIENSTGNERMQMGAFVMNFSLDGTLKNLVTGYIIQDNVDKIKIQFHKPDDNETPPDPEFRDGAASNQRYSFIVKGTFNGAPFVYRSKQSMQAIVNLSSLVAMNLTNMNVTVLFNKLDWFRNGSNVLDPNDPQNVSIIDDNIKNSFKQAFKDDDMDGNPDGN
jgi:hypothetical protein